MSRVEFEPTISAGEGPKDLRLRPRGHWDRQTFYCNTLNIVASDNNAIDQSGTILIISAY